MPQFGKQIQSQQIPGWGAYYLDYKALKKIISSLASSQSPSSTAIRPNDLFGLVRVDSQAEVPIVAPPTETPTEVPAGFSPAALSLFPGQDHDPPSAGSVFHAHKASFFFKLERELEKVCTLYPCVAILTDI